MRVMCPTCGAAEVVEIGEERSAFFQAVEPASDGGILVACAMCGGQFKVGVVEP